MLFGLVACNRQNDNTENKVTISNEKIDIIDTFFSQYQVNPQLALSTLALSNPFLDSSQVTLMTAKLTDLLPQIGKYHGYDLITRNEVSSNYVLYSYILYHERQPIKFNFIIYKLPKQTWKISNVEFSADLEEELKQSSQLYLLNKIYGGSASK